MVSSSYAEARQLGVARDWFSVFHYELEKLVREISIKLLENSLTIEEVYKAAGLSDVEYVLKKKLLWNRVLAFLEDKTCTDYILGCAVLKERALEITMNLLKMNIQINSLNLSTKTISNATGISLEEVEQLKDAYKNDPDSVFNHWHVSSPSLFAVKDTMTITENMLKKGMSIDDVNEATGLSIEEIKRILEKHKK